MELTSNSLLEVLARYGDAATVAAQREAAGEWLRGCGRAILSGEKIERLLDSAAATVGMPCVGGERERARQLAQELRGLHRQVRQLERAIQAQVASEATLEQLAKVIGAVSAAVRWACLGDPRGYPNATSYLKGGGLNLKEHSSGTHQGQLKLTKRGPAAVRFYLYYTALRLVAHDPLIQRGYQAKSARPGAVKGKCLVALMRKLAKALWHVAQGARFATAKLVNIEAVLRP